MPETTDTIQTIPVAEDPPLAKQRSVAPKHAKRGIRRKAERHRRRQRDPIAKGRRFNPASRGRG